jgi:hypothetical protein
MIMVRGISRRDAIITGVVAAIVVLGVIGYFVFIRDGDGGGGDNGDDEPVNLPPDADAGFDQTIYPGEQANFSAQSSFDPDGDDLYYYWDMDAGIDSDSDGIKDNDRDLVGMEVSYMYPIAYETIEYFVTLTVADRPPSNPNALTDTDVTKVIIYVSDSGGETPTITMSCNHVPGVPGLSEPHFLVRIEDATSEEMISNFTFRLDDEGEGLILNGSVSDIILVPPNATIRFVDTSLDGRIGIGDTFTIKETDVIQEGCWFSLYYEQINEEPEMAGDVELIGG